MTSRYASVLHALSVEPRTARPGETVRMVFRTRNLGAVPSPRGTVRFLPAAGLEVVPDVGDRDPGCDTADQQQCSDAIVPVDGVPPGDEVVAEIVARVAHPMDDLSTLDVQAVLEVDGASFGTNVCTVVVRSCAVLDGALSGSFVEAIDDHTVRVRAVVTNEGDGPACDVQIVVPTPVGCVALDDGPGESLERSPGTTTIARIEAGERVEIAFDARIVEPVGIVRAEAAYVAFAGGTRCSIPARGDVLLQPLLARPEVQITPSRRRVDVSACVRNDGWADACDARVRIVLPAELRLVEGSVVVDGVPLAPRVSRGKSRDTSFARFEKADGAIVVAISRIPARCAVRVSLAAQVPAGYGSGDISVSIGLGGPEVVVPFVVDLARDVRAHIVDVPRAVAAGERAAMVAEVSNLGDVPETVTVRAVLRDLVLDEGACTLTVQPGHVVPATLAFDVPDTCGATRLPVAVVVSDAERERARAQHAVVVRAVVSAVAAVEPVAVHHTPRGPAVRAVLVAPSDVLAGAPFSVSLMVDAADAMEWLTIRIPAPIAATYVAGSTVLDGCVLLDRDGSSPLHGDGLTLRDLRGSAHVAVTWSLLAAAGADVSALELTALLHGDGMSVRVDPVNVPVRAGAAFSVRPAGLQYHVDARAVDCARDVAQVAFGEDDRFAGIDAAPLRALDVAGARRDAGVAALLRDIGIGASLPDIGVSARMPHGADDAPEDDWRAAVEGENSSVFVLRLDGGRVDEIARAMRGAGPNTLISHVVALRALLPDLDASRSAAIDRACGGDTSSIGPAFDELAGATRDVFDRLFVKLRIPGFGVEASDIEDPTMRRALVVLFRALGHDSTIAAFVDSPLGSPEVLRALVTLVPSRCDAEPLLGAALRFYACALDEALARLTGIPLELYEVALARDAGFMLADARAAVVSALPAATLSGAA